MDPLRPANNTQKNISEASLVAGSHDYPTIAAAPTQTWLVLHLSQPFEGFASCNLAGLSIKKNMDMIMNTVTTKAAA